MSAPLRRSEAPGAVLLEDDVCRFAVWAPIRERVDIVLVGDAERVVSMQRGEDGVHRADVRGVRAGQRYLYRLDGGLERPDPASRLQPDGVHGASCIVPRLPSRRPYRGAALRDLVIYQLHVGTFSDEGTFAAAIAHLDDLAELGVGAIELLPIAQFAGERNWGYDGVYPYAVQASYGGPSGLAQLIDAAHARDFAVFLDVVYNHLGPEGNYLADFGPYFNARYQTPWGAAVNFDGPGSDGVRWYFIESALYYLETFGVDGFRVDAVHAFFDMSAEPFLAELTEAIHRRAEELRRTAVVIGESDLNDARVLRPRPLGGFGMEAQWSDDFHHALHALLTGENRGYYRDFGRLSDLGEAFREGWVYDGRWSAARGRRHGNSPRGLEPDRFVVYSQTHDQIGNRAHSDRLGASLSLAGRKLAAAAVLLSPFVPMLFMGQEYGETAPFCYFTSHGDPELAAAVRRGRLDEFVAFGWVPEDVPDPQDEATFTRCRLDHGLRAREPHRALWQLYRELIDLRRRVPALRAPAKRRVDVAAHDEGRALVVRRRWQGHEAVLLLGFSAEACQLRVDLGTGPWHRVLDTEDTRWGGAGSAIPEVIEASGATSLELAASSAVLLARAPAPRR